MHDDTDVAVARVGGKVAALPSPDFIIPANRLQIIVIGSATIEVVDMEIHILNQRIQHVSVTCRIGERVVSHFQMPGDIRAIHIIPREGGLIAGHAAESEMLGRPAVGVQQNGKFVNQTVIEIGGAVVAEGDVTVAAREVGIAERNVLEVPRAGSGRCEGRHMLKSGIVARIGHHAHL